MDDDDIKQRMWFGLAEFAFKYRYAQGFAKVLETVFQWMNRLDKCGGADFASAVLEYIMNGMEKGEKQLFLEKANEC